MAGDSSIVEAGVVYVSEAATPFDDQRIARLADQAAAKNASIGVTGYLYFSNERFVQFLEGSGGVVTDLLAQIEQDTRHEIVATVWRNSPVERRFPKWSMHWVRQNEMTKIGLEHILADQVLLQARVDWRDLGLKPSIWRLIDSVADSLHNHG